jgi:hypothetical protein
MKFTVGGTLVFALVASYGSSQYGDFGRENQFELSILN